MSGNIWEETMNTTGDTTYEAENQLSMNLITCAAIIICLATIISNTLIILTVLTNKVPGTPHNYLLVSLAASDLIIGLLFMPFGIVYDQSETWYYGETACMLWLSCGNMGCTASVYNLCIIAIDRVWAVSNPLAYNNKNRSFNVLTSIVWSSAVLAALIMPLLGFRGWNERHSKCDFSNGVSFLYKMAMLFILPYAIMISSYIYIYRLVVRRQQSNRPRFFKADIERPHETAQRGSEKDVQYSVTQIILPPVFNSHVSTFPRSSCKTTQLQHEETSVLSTDVQEDEPRSCAASPLQQLVDSKHHSAPTNSDHTGPLQTSVTCRMTQIPALCSLEQQCSLECGINSRFVGCVNLQTVLSANKKNEMNEKTVSKDNIEKNRRGEMMKCSVSSDKTHGECDNACGSGNRSREGIGNENPWDGSDISHVDTKCSVCITENINGDSMACVSGLHGGDHFSSDGVQLRNSLHIDNTTRLPHRLGERLIIPESASSCPNDAVGSVSRRIALISSVSVGIFVLCSLPYFIFEIVRASLSKPVDWKKEWHWAASWLLMLTSSLNPLVYTMFNRDFRKAFRSILKR